MNYNIQNQEVTLPSSALISTLDAISELLREQYHNISTIMMQDTFYDFFYFYENGLECVLRCQSIFFGVFTLS